MSLDFRNDLNSEQYLAATSNARHLRIIAGAGTGKTRTLTYRLAHLIARGDIRPSQIVAITFTNKAASEMKDRTKLILEKSGLENIGNPTVCTFHAFCCRFLRKELATHYTGFTNFFLIADEADQKSIFKKAAERLNIPADSKQYKDAIKIVQNYKTKGIEWGELKDGGANFMTNIDIKEFYKSYQTMLAASNLIDFDDILIFTRDILVNDKYCAMKYQSFYKAFMIDEFQDTNDLQYNIVRLFMSEEAELCVVGDPDQTIYTWRGANNAIIKKWLERDFKDLETITLDINYRSTQKILDKANMLIKNNKNRVDKSLSAFTKEVGEDVDFFSSQSAEDEAMQVALRINNLHRNKGVNYSDIAIIYRSNFLSRVIEKRLRMANVPYKLLDAVSFYDRLEVKAGLAYLRLLINTEDTVSFLRVLQSPSRKIGDKTLGLLSEQASNNQRPLFDYIVNNIGDLQATPSVKDSLVKLVGAYNKCLSDIDQASDNKGIVEAIKNYFNNTGLVDYVKGLDKKDEESGVSEKDNARQNNLDELVSAIKEYLDEADINKDESQDPSLMGFLINVSLLSSQDKSTSGNSVLVMTGHVSKGLEFPCVFVTGLVEGIFPTNHAIEDQMNSPRSEAIEEERRLLYVAITRAKKYLCLSSFSGVRNGNMPNMPSRFVKEIGFKVTRQSYGDEWMYNKRTDRHSDYFASSHNKPSYSGVYRSIDKSYGSKGFIAPEGDISDYGYSPENVAKVSMKHVSSSSSLSSNNASDVVYNIGDKIAHASFGIGVVTEVLGNKIVVDFGGENGKKTLVKGFKAFRKI